MNRERNNLFWELMLFWNGWNHSGITLYSHPSFPHVSFTFEEAKQKNSTIFFYLSEPKKVAFSFTFGVVVGFIAGVLL